jgi:hypothetical protein
VEREKQHNSKTESITNNGYIVKKCLIWGRLSNATLDSSPRVVRAVGREGAEIKGYVLWR